MSSTGKTYHFHRCECNLFCFHGRSLILLDLVASAWCCLKRPHMGNVQAGVAPSSAPAYVIAHGRFSSHGRPAPWIAADIVRVEDGKLAEHWDVLQDEATQAGIPEWPPDAW
jgi:hypothetical protein